MFLAHPYTTVQVHTFGFFICLFLLFGELVELTWVFSFFVCAVIRGFEEFEWSTTPLSVSWHRRGISVVYIPGDLFFI
jgi:hypothetical protein